jgi:outer membrane protein OmpA-like peptidoglycan-associated protein
MANTPGDVYEQEADRIADHVMATPTHHSVSGVPPRIQRFSRSSTRQVDAAPGSVDYTLPGPGRPLEPALQQEMEQRFGRDFSQVRIHSGTPAEESARRLNANAYTVGHNIVFGAGRSALGTLGGRRLLAHELTHVVQQSSADASHSDNGPLPISRCGIAIQRDTPKDTEERPGHNLKQEGYGSKALSKGVMIWSIFSVEKANAAVVQIIFVPYKSYRDKPITFLQTVLDKQETGDIAQMPVIDILTYGKTADDTKDDPTPFYGAEWDNKIRSWSAAGAPSVFRNQPGGVTDPGGTTYPDAYLYDRPFVYPGEIKLFETVAVVPETAETLGAIKWGVRGHKDGVKVLAPDKDKDVDDRPSAGFLVALDTFYAQPPTVGPHPQQAERYDAILESFPSNDGTSKQRVDVLTDVHKKQLDPIVAKIKKANDPTMLVSIEGFADATEKDPNATSEARARAVESYLLAQGVPIANIVMAGFFGAAWARYPPSAMESRNRRVQVRVHWGPNPK